MTPEQVIADALDEYEGLDISGMAIIVRNDLRAAGLLLGPDKVAVDRETVALAIQPAWGYAAEQAQIGALRSLRAALSEPQPKPEGTS